MKLTNKSLLPLIAAYLLLGLLFSCSKPDKPSKAPAGQTSFTEFSFKVDTSLLGERLELAGIEFNIPRGWNPVIEGMMELMRKHAAKDTSKLGMSPDYAYSVDDGSVLVISRFIRSNQERAAFSSWALEVGQAYQDARTEHKLDMSWISLNNLEALQIFASDTATTHLKLLVNADEPVSIDFTIPKKVWQYQTPTVESSLGSMMRLESPTK